VGLGLAHCEAQTEPGQLWWRSLWFVRRNWIGKTGKWQNAGVGGLEMEEGRLFEVLSARLCDACTTAAGQHSRQGPT
jgi:hypothetical protein